jgi:methylglyoxal synthase
VTTGRRLRIGLVASRLHRSGPGAALFRLLRPLERALVDELQAEIHAVGLTCDAMTAAGLFRDYAGLHRLPTRRDGGLIHLVAGVVSDDPGRRFDTIIYLLDPDDPTSVFPEGQALKRECVIHGTTFISTFAHAQEWFELARVTAGFAPDPAHDRWFDFATQTIALIAHDARKDALLDFVRRHYAFFDAFGARIATGTTGSLLDGMAEEMPGARPGPWLRRFRSGPLGGDAEIALEVLEKRCQRIVFFEDPHVARQHEADIQLLERSARIVSDGAACISDAASARRWIAGCALRHARHA